MNRIGTGALALAAALAATAASAAEKPVIAKICTNCHQPQAGSLRGYFDSAAFKSRSIQIRMDDAVEIVAFDPARLEVLEGARKEPAEYLRQVKKSHEIRIAFEEKDGKKVATAVSLKQPMKVPAEMLITTAELEKLVAQGPEKGAYTLIDSRPLPRFQEGFIPTAQNLPFPAFDKLQDKLPTDKARLLVFYCAGPTCSMSPKSADKAKALGYTNVRVYHEGMPAWSKGHFGLLAAQHLKEAWIDKDIPAVLLDVRPADEAEKGFIQGAVGMPAGALAKGLRTLPPADKKAPIIVYGAGQEAEQAAARIIAAGQSNVKVLAGGFEAWKSAGYPVATGKLGRKVAWAPKPRPGEIAWDEFTRLAKKIPADTLILDVRNDDEAQSGMIHGARQIPAEDLEKRLAELPRDKRIVAHCSTGVRAEMAYHLLKEKGFEKLAFLNGNIAIDNRGRFKLSR
ncbi:MAG: sulfurtransferase [Deltaproteobacteria bacterium]|nr:sulfurtransferase [Deltaproteobacteria bacterium]